MELQSRTGIAAASPDHLGGGEKHVQADAPQGWGINMYGSLFTHWASQPAVVLLPAFAQVNLFHAGFRQVLERAYSQHRPDGITRKVRMIARVLAMKNVSDELSNQKSARGVFQVENIDSKPFLFGTEPEIRLGL